MGEQTLDQIYTRFRAGFQDTPDYAIDFYRNNASLLEKLERFSNPGELKYFIELKWHYINALLQRGYYNQAIDEANLTLPVVDFEAARLGIRLLGDEWYAGIIYVKGVANYKLRNYKEAAPVFKGLLKQDPENDLYFKWYQNALYGLRLRWVNAIWAASAFILLFVLFFEEFIPGKEVRLGITILGFSGVVGNLAYEYYSRRSFRRNTIVADQL